MTADEWKFIISHECNHVICNHSLCSLLVNIPNVYSKIVSLLGNNPIYKTFFDFFRIVLAKMTGNDVPIEAELIKNQEIESNKML